MHDSHNGKTAKRTPCQWRIGNLTAFRDIERSETYACIKDIVTSRYQADPAAADECMERYFDSVSEMTAAAEDYGVSGDIWQTWLAILIAGSENPFSLSQERRAPLSGTISDMARMDMVTLCGLMSYGMKRIADEFGYFPIPGADDFKPLPSGPVSFGRIAGKAITELAAAMRSATTPDALFNAVVNFYSTRGVGKYGLYSGFRWDAHKREIVPAELLEDIRLTDLVGYEDQKKTVVDNTEAFLEGRPANNVLLYGEGGTGKSSTIKALLNEYAPRGLRMIEVYKHQINDLETILDEIKRRNYRFILFMDDLSFEEFEVEYKFLKAFIEGGIERRPENVLIYATSNRRHLMKETWRDRSDKYDDDVHESETMQEKLSLVDRFGLLIRYISPEQKEYLNIVRTLAAEYGVDVPDQELERGAIRWELKHGGFSGRSARQYVEFLAGKKQ